MRLALLALAAIPASVIHAKPEGLQPTSDTNVLHQGIETLIRPGKARTVLNWESYSINQGERVRYEFAKKDWVSVNKVLGRLESRIAGELLANGRVVLINPNGIIVDKTGRIDTNGIILTTRPLKDEKAFLSGASGVGKFTFEGDSAATIVNLGTINGGDHVFLIAHGIDNQGVISALNGTAVLATGTSVSIETVGADGALKVSRSLSTAQITNAGTVRAGLVKLMTGNATMASTINPKTNNHLTASTSGPAEVTARVGSIHNTGVIEATGGRMAANRPVVTPFTKAKRL